ncbi:hypothetical protein [Herbidospora cretacea]|uniref:hypothetical protein n=1 Tax=Herbidospora cretacea TaxID=28444 RepID=UPI0004C2E8D6|nr:hypothetical protein [Herbidospora cretacea]
MKKKWNVGLGKPLLWVAAMTLFPGFAHGVTDYLVQGPERITGEYLLARILVYGGAWLVLSLLVIKFGGEAGESEQKPE